MEIFLFAAYLLLFTWCIPKIRFFSNSGLSGFQLAVLFLLKVVAGVIYGWINWRAGGISGSTDTWMLHIESLKETKTLLTYPRQYLVSFFYDGSGTGFENFFTSSASYWNNLKNNTYIRIESVFNCFSFGSYFVNVIFYSFCVFFGVVALYRVMRHHLSGSQLLLITGCFLAPSFLYWTSGLHKDGLTFLALSTIIYIFYFRITSKKPAQGFLLLLGALLLLFALRNHVLLVLLPALLCWVLARRLPARRVLIFAGVYSLGLIFFFSAKYLHPALDFPAIVAGKQGAFRALTGGQSSLTVDPLQPDVTGFIRQLPQAAGIVLFRPLITDIKKVLVFPAFLEVLLTWSCILLFLIIPRQKRSFSPFSLFLLAFTVSALLMIGYTVNNLGAVVRYRSILFPLFLPVILTGIRWEHFIKK
ncbi:hypothetical protein LL912_23625 [Niabella sp. CC-SYL272]|uniref:hypothetical protein n=1 Tax=Niabella agricola TaxID=2891571 RepID=UPI001F40B972|nr:hypothetical protein [Niabella agricola]MCF3111798.1 hypothetical protein [Niabella agricola]